MRSLPEMCGRTALLFYYSRENITITGRFGSNGGPVARRVVPLPGLCYHLRMEINVLVDEEFAGKIKEDWLVGVVSHVLAEEKAHTIVELSVVVTNQATVQELNQKYLKEEGPTDVLSFSAQEEEASSVTPFVQPPDNMLHLGEVIINYPQAEAQGAEHGHSAAKEVAILTIHGVLHLLGYDHDTPARTEAMKGRESAILKSLSVDF